MKTLSTEGTLHSTCCKVDYLQYHQVDFYKHGLKTFLLYVDYGL